MRSPEAAAAVGVSVATLRRWTRAGLVPEYDGAWTPAALGKARLIRRLRDRGYTLEQIGSATAEGRLAFGRILELFQSGGPTQTRRQAARGTGLDAATVERVALSLGLAADEPLDEVAMEVLGHVAAAVRAGLPPEAMQQLTRVYARAISQIADAEVRLVHLYVHEPLMRAGGTAEDMAEAMLTIAEGLLPISTPLLEQLHRRMLMHFIDQDVIGHMEAEPASGEERVGRMRVAIAFADLAGYTRLTETHGDLHAVDVVDRFIAAVTATLPEGARVIKTIGDEVMVVGPDPRALAAWAAQLGRGPSTGLRPRAAVHYGDAQYRAGDYFGREVNLAARVQAESGAGEVLLTRAVLEAPGAGGAGAGPLQVEPLPEVRLRGFSRPIELFRLVEAGRP
jgi:adenylate cyclase